MAGPSKEAVLAATKELPRRAFRRAGNENHRYFTNPELRGHVSFQSKRPAGSFQLKARLYPPFKFREPLLERPLRRVEICHKSVVALVVRQVLFYGVAGN